VSAAPAGPFPGGPPLSGAAPLTRLSLELTALSGALRTCADFVLAHPWEVRGLAIRDLAARAGVSSPSVNRLSRRIGFSGYREFSQALAMELGRIAGAAYAIPEPLSRHMLRGAETQGGTRVETPAGGQAGQGEPVDEAMTVVSQVFAMEQAALQDTWRSLDRAAVSGAVRSLARARNVLFVTVGAGLGVCEVAAYRFKVLGLRAACTGDPATVIPEIHLLEPGDVVVGVSYHGHSSSVVDGLAYAQGRRLTTICITAAAGSPVAARADLALVVFGRDEALGFGQFASRVSTAALLEALTTAVAWVRRDTAVAHANEVTLAAQHRNSVFHGPEGRRRRNADRTRDGTRDSTSDGGA
jgi:DNA-binding MurR/RpiR family transcriptional regulator